MTNIFEIIGKHIEDNKRKKELFDNKYWKLSPIERIDYDNKKERIEKENHWGFFPITISLVSLLITITLATLLFYFISGMNIAILIIGILIFSFFYSLLGFIFLFDLIFMFLSSNSRKKKKIELNKRFKL